MIRYLTGICLPLLVACAPEDTSSVEVDSSGLEAPVKAPTTEGAMGWDGVVAFVNAPDTSLEVLDLDVGLDRRAAERIIRHRDGADRVGGTEDDNLFDTVDELLSVDWVGPTTVELIEAWLDDAATDGEVVDGVAFTDDEAILVVSLANTADADYLDYDLELDVRAVDNILDARPIADIHELGRVSYVGPATLERLRSAITQ